MYTARLIGVMRYGEVPDEFRGFVEFQASLEKRSPAYDDPVALLIVEGTESIHPVFLKDVDVDEVEERLGKLQTALPPGVKAELRALAR